MIEAGEDEKYIDEIGELLFSAVKGCICDLVFYIKDGTTLWVSKMMSVLSPNKTKLLLCYGGFRVTGKKLLMQTGFQKWEYIFTFRNKSVAKLALQQALNSGVANFETK